MYGGYGIGDIETNWKKDNANSLITAIAGNSVGGGGAALISVSVAKGEDSGPITIEIGVRTAAGTTLFYSRKAEVVKNIYNK